MRQSCHCNHGNDINWTRKKIIIKRVQKTNKQYLISMNWIEFTFCSQAMQVIYTQRINFSRTYIFQNIHWKKWYFVHVFTPVSLFYNYFYVSKKFCRINLIFFDFFEFFRFLTWKRCELIIAALTVLLKQEKFVTFWFWFLMLFIIDGNLLNIYEYSWVWFMQLEGHKNGQLSMARGQKFKPAFLMKMSTQKLICDC